MGIYAFNTDVLMRVLQEGGDDFGKDVIPRMANKRSCVFVYDFTKNNEIEDFTTQVEDGRRNKRLVERTRDSSYWRDVGSIDSYYDSSMDLMCV
jgi:glucose-1-phosphate adenylyltransferase